MLQARLAPSCQMIQDKQYETRDRAQERSSGMTTDIGDSRGRPLKAWMRALERTAPITKNPLVTLPMVIDKQADTLGTKPALLAGSECLTYAALAELSHRYSRWALQQNIAHGDVVALIMPNCPAYMAIWLGITRVGGVVALINTNLASAALAHCIAIVAPKHVVVAAELEGALVGTLPSLPPGVRIWVHGESRHGFPDIAQDVSQHAGKPLAETDFSSPSLADRALCIYTSGTTGLPKAANVSHFRVMQWCQWFAGLMDIGPTDRMYNCLPMYHSIGGVVAMGAPLVAGGSVMIRERFSASRFWDDVIEWDCTLFQYIGELCRYLVQSPRHPKEARHRIRLCCGNGLREDVWDAFKTRFHIPQILEYYAATEANFSLFNCEEKPGVIGRIPPFLAQRTKVALIKVDVETGTPIRNDDGLCQRCVAGGAGEALAKIGDGGASQGSRFEGYTDKTASERKILRGVFAAGDAWYRTGDLMRQDEQGFFYFIDRLGDTFRWKGENVSTAEVAEALTACPGVIDAVVYGVPVPGTEGRAGMAALMIGDDFDLAAFHSHVAARLPLYARPLFLRICSEFAMTATFRPKSFELAREGYDPGAIADALYVDDRDKEAFVPLDSALYARIVSQEMRL
jgi:fatty-acyl-CoA synthase